MTSPVKNENVYILLAIPAVIVVLSLILVGLPIIRQLTNPSTETPTASSKTGVVTIDTHTLEPSFTPTSVTFTPYPTTTPTATPTPEVPSLTPTLAPSPTSTVATATSTFTPTPPVMIVAPTPTPWWFLYSHPPCREDIGSGRSAELPCLYRVQENDSWRKISYLFYDDENYFWLLRDLNRLENGLYRSLLYRPLEDRLLYIPDIKSDVLPQRFPPCDDKHQPPCLHTVYKGDDFNPADTYEIIAQTYFRKLDDPIIEDAVQCIRDNNLDEEGNTHPLTGKYAPTHITIPSCPRKEP